MTTVRYLDPAEEEFLTEIEYLEQRTKGLGRRFFHEVKRVEGLIARFPEAGEEIRPGIRKRLLRTFRHSVVYSVEPEGVLIIAIAHHSRRPGYWSSRPNPG